MAQHPFRRIGVILMVLAVVSFIPAGAVLYTDWLWFLETGYGQIYRTTWMTRALLPLGGFLVGFPVLFINFFLALRLLRAHRFTIRSAQEDAAGTSRSPNRKPLVVIVAPTDDERFSGLSRDGLRGLVLAATLIVAALIGFYLSQHEMVWLQFRHAVPFGEVDPLFGRDVGFYVFTLPFYRLVHHLMFLLISLALVGSFALYQLSGGLRLDPELGFTVHLQARRHLSLIVAGLFAVALAGAWLHRYELLLSPSSVGFGASYVDVHVRLAVLNATMVIAALGIALSVGHAFWKGSWPLVTAGLLFGLIQIGGGAFAGIVQRLVVTPNEQAREMPFIVHNIEATRRAFGIDNVEDRAISGDSILSREEVSRNAATIENVRLWDHQPLLDTIGQMQEIRTYYDFVSVDNDRYVIDGRSRQIMLAARELGSESLPNRSWINTHLTFTHGYGLALGPVNQVTPEGLPVLFVKDLPPQSLESAEVLKIREPSIYFGERSSEYVFVRTAAQEFHYPRGEDNVYVRYEGNGGIEIDGLVRKALFSLRFQTLKILLSDDLIAGSRVLIHRQIIDRVRTLAPFLTIDPDPYLVISDQRLFWIIDAYTLTNRYPYSSPYSPALNYLRNPIKVVIDAYHGTTTFYLADPSDPIAQTYDRIFPGFLKPLDQMPEDLRKHIRYPEEIFSIQVAMYATYHMTNPSVFYNKEDQWEIPVLQGGSEASQESEARGSGSGVMEPYYTIMRLPGEPSPEFIQMLPLTPRRKDNLAAWMVARSDPPNYGQLKAFQFPKQKVVFGPRQIEARINQDQNISPQLTLWNQQGSEVIQGTLLVIPIEESLLYIRPLYLRSSGGRIPELKRVIVANQHQIVMDETLEKALNRLFDHAEEEGGAEGNNARSGAGPSGGISRPVADGGVAEGRASGGGAAVDAIGSAATGSGRDRDGSTGPLEPRALAQRARSLYDEAIEAQRAGDWARYGERLRALGGVINQLSAEDQARASRVGEIDAVTPAVEQGVKGARQKQGSGSEAGMVGTPQVGQTQEP